MWENSTIKLIKSNIAYQKDIMVKGEKKQLNIRTAAR